MDSADVPRFRRSRSSRACLVCRVRKIRCDADQKVPCSNCVSFKCQCSFPVPKRVKRTPATPLSITTILPPSGPVASYSGVPQGPFVDSRVPYPPQHQQLQPHSFPQQHSLPLQQYPQLQPSHTSPPQHFFPHHTYPEYATNPAYGYVPGGASPPGVPSVNVATAGTTPAIGGLVIPHLGAPIAGQVPGIPVAEGIHTYVPPPVAHTAEHIASIPAKIKPEHGDIAEEDEPVELESEPEPKASSSHQEEDPQVESTDSADSTRKNRNTSEPHITISFTYNDTHHGQPFNYVPPNMDTSGTGRIVDDGNHSYIPGDAIANISTRDLTPKFDIESNTFQNSDENGVKISLSRKLSEYTYFGPTSVYTFIREDEDQNEFFTIPEVGDDYGDIGPVFPKANGIPPQEVLCELTVLKIKRAFELPSRYICSLIIDSFFDHMYPQIPIINKEVFLAHFNDPNPKKQPPLMLLQAILLVGSRTCRHPALQDANGNFAGVADAFYARTRALCDSTLKLQYVGDSSMEDDGHLIFNYPTVMAQTFGLLSWYWEAPEDVSRGPYFVLRTAMDIAIVHGFNRDVEKSVVISTLFKRYKNSKTVTPYKIKQQCYYWRKLWWWLFTRDRSMSMSFGRPFFVDMRTVELSMITEKDYEDYESGWSKDDAADKLASDFFIHLIKLCEIIGVVLNEQYLFNESSSAARRSNVVKQGNYLMACFLEQMPRTLKFSVKIERSHNLYSCLIGSLYYVTLYHINRVKLISVNGSGHSNIYWGISFQSACIMAIIAQHLMFSRTESEKLAIPFQMLYSLSMGATFLSYHLKSSNEVVAKAAGDQINNCLEFLKHCNTLWPSMTYLLSGFFAEYNKDGKSRFPLRATKLLFKICVEYQLGSSDPTIKLPGMGFIMNQEESKNKNHEFALDDLDYSDQNLPIHKVQTMKVPLPQSEEGKEFYTDFSAARLFPICKNADVDQSPSPATSSVSKLGLNARAGSEINSENTPYTEGEAVGSSEGHGSASSYSDGQRDIKDEIDEFDRFGSKKDGNDIKMAGKGEEDSDGAGTTLNMMFNNEYFLTAQSGIDWLPF